MAAKSAFKFANMHDDPVVIVSFVAVDGGPGANSLSDICLTMSDSGTKSVAARAQADLIQQLSASLSSTRWAQPLPCHGLCFGRLVDPCDFIQASMGGSEPVQRSLIVTAALAEALEALPEQCCEGALQDFPGTTQLQMHCKRPLTGRVSILSTCHQPCSRGAPHQKTF